ncbi:hypothetical protein FACS1894206_03560 [Deltaproteobacteria bacterium]|nr:hypothetical protein FACS1894206_03560 [Deltaproteobacteria bacterium]
MAKSHIFTPKIAKKPGLGGVFLRAGVIGLHPVAGLLVGGACGYFLWKQFDAAWCFWVFLLIGFIAGWMNAYGDIRVMMREQDAEDAEKKS